MISGRGSGCVGNTIDELKKTRIENKGQFLNFLEAVSDKVPSKIDFCLPPDDYFGADFYRSDNDIQREQLAAHAFQNLARFAANSPYFASLPLPGKVKSLRALEMIVWQDVISGAEDIIYREEDNYLSASLLIKPLNSNLFAYRVESVAPFIPLYHEQLCQGPTRIEVGGVGMVEQYLIDISNNPIPNDCIIE